MEHCLSEVDNLTSFYPTVQQTEALWDYVCECTQIDRSILSFSEEICSTRDNKVQPCPAIVSLLAGGRPPSLLVPPNFYCGGVCANCTSLPQCTPKELAGVHAHCISCVQAQAASVEIAFTSSEERKLTCQCLEHMIGHSSTVGPLPSDDLNCCDNFTINTFTGSTKHDCTLSSAHNKHPEHSVFVVSIASHGLPRDISLKLSEESQSSISVIYCVYCCKFGPVTQFSSTGREVHADINFFLIAAKFFLITHIYKRITRFCADDHDSNNINENFDFARHLFFFAPQLVPRLWISHEDNPSRSTSDAGGCFAEETDLYIDEINSDVDSEALSCLPALYGPVRVGVAEVARCIGGDVICPVVVPTSLGDEESVYLKGFLVEFPSVCSAERAVEKASCGIKEVIKNTMKKQKTLNDCNNTGAAELLSSTLRLSSGYVYCADNFEVFCNANNDSLIKHLVDAGNKVLCKIVHHNALLANNSNNRIIWTCGGDLPEREKYFLEKKCLLNILSLSQEQKSALQTIHKHFDEKKIVEEDSQEICSFSYAARNCSWFLLLFEMARFMISAHKIYSKEDSTDD